MRKSFVLALVLVMAVASASLAATPSFSGNLKLTAKSDGSFTGPFTLTPSARVDVNFAESGDNWSLDARLRATWNGKDDVTFGIHRYKGVLQAGSVTAMAWRNYEEKNIDTPFRWVRLAGEPGEKVDALRLSADVSGVQIDAQLQNDDADKNDLRLRAETKVSDFTIGAGIRHGMGTDATSDYVLYGKTSVGIVDLTGMYGSLAGDGHYLVDVAAKVTDAITVGATYTDVSHGSSKKGYGVRANFTQGLLYADAKHWELNSETQFWFKYRGSEDNQPFSILFNEDEDDWNDDWYKNVAPAFGVNYTSKTTEPSKIKLYGVAPFSKVAVGRAKVETSDGKTGFALEARFNVSDKLVLNPYASQDLGASDTTLGAKAIYTVSDNSKITVDAKQEGSNQSLTAEYSIDF